MNSKLVAISALGALSLLCARATAEEFGDNGTFAVGVDRVFGAVYFSQSYDALTTPAGPTTKRETSITNFALFGRYASVSVAQIPRFAFDAVVGPGITLGGAVMYDHYSTNNKTAGQDTGTTSTGLWLVSPRIGFAKMFTPQIGIWPRAGVMYTHLSSEFQPVGAGATNASSSTGSWVYTMDVNLVVAPVPHVGFTLGPTLDYLLSQSTSQTPPDTTPNTNYKWYAIGVQAGIFAWF